MKICSVCGSVNGADNKFCRKCGSPLSASTQPVRVKPISNQAKPTSNQAKPTKKVTAATPQKPSLEPIPQMDVEEPFDISNPLTEKSAEPAEIEEPVSWRPFQKPSPFTKPPSRPPAETATPRPQARPPAGKGQMQTPALIPIRPRPVEEMSITEKISFYQPPGKTASTQKKSKDKKELQKSAGSQSKTKLIPLSKMTSNVEEQEEEQEEEEEEEIEEAPPQPRPKRDSKSHRPSAQKRAGVTDSKSAALSQIMSEAMRSLSQQLGLVKPAQKKVIAPQAPAVVEEVEPQTMNDILTDLARIDPNIDASSIIRQDGTILAAATSRRLNENLLSVITGTLSTISRDVVQAMEAGKLKFTSIHGTQGILFLAPLFADMFLIVYTNPLCRPGVINVASHRVKAQLMKYMGLKEGDVEAKSAS